MIEAFWPFFFLTLLLMGGCAWLTGQALARTWRPMWQAVIAMLGLGAADRFLHYALFQGSLLSAGHYIFDSTILIAVALISYRMTKSKLMTTQYPWEYVRVGLLGWRQRNTTTDI